MLQYLKYKLARRPKLSTGGVIKELASLIQCHFNSHKTIDDEPISDAQAIRSIVALEAAIHYLSTNPPDWRPVSDLPERYLPVLIAVPEETPQIGFHDGKLWCHTSGDPIDSDNLPTHWMPLFEPPTK